MSSVPPLSRFVRAPAVSAANRLDTPPGLPSGPRAHCWLVALLVAYALCAVPVMLDVPLVSSAETRCWTVVQEMLATGDWLVPREDGAVRLQKPPLAYWTSALSAQLAGSQSLLVLRLPSLVAGLALLIVTYAWGRSAGGDGLGLAAAGALAAMESFVALGGRGVAEMQLALFATLALVLFQRLLRRGSTALCAGFAVSFALALLAKATVAILVVGLPIAVVLTTAKRWRSALRPAPLVWLAASFLPIAAWYAAILVNVPEAGATLRDIALLPLGHQPTVAPVGAAHYQPAWLHLKWLASGAAPAIALLPWAVRRAWTTRAWRGLPVQRFAAVVVASLFLAFTLLPQKQKHYLLPLLPALALLLADGARAATLSAGLTRRLGYAAGGLLLVVGTGIAAWQAREGRLVMAGVVGTVGAVLGLLLLVAARRGIPRRLAGVCVASALVAFMLHGLLHESLLQQGPAGP